MSSFIGLEEQREALRYHMRQHTIKKAQEAALKDDLVLVDETEDEGADLGDVINDDAELRDYFGVDQDDKTDGLEPVPQARRQAKRASNTLCHRNLPPDSPWETITHIMLGESRLTPGKSVELLRSDKNKSNPHFLTVRRIDRNVETGQVMLFGLAVFRNTYAKVFPGQYNEVHLSLEEDMDDKRPLDEQSMIQCDAEDVWRIRKIIYTNLNFPKLSFREHTYLCKSKMTKTDFRRQEAYVKSSCELVCRYASIKRFQNAAARLSKNKHQQWDQVLRKLYQNEDPTKRTPLQLKRVEQTHIVRNALLHKRERHTYNSGFCGCGGDCLGARMAGFIIKCAFDKDELSSRTFKLNFRGTRHMLKEAFEVVQSDNDAASLWSTVWHLSCPCQTWSPAHTHEAVTDADNMAALSCVEPLLKKIKPTILTLEQTSGLVTHHPEFFAYLLHQISSSGYNVRWRLAKFQNHGLSSMRKRLVIFASRVGHPIPEFPEETHGSDPGLVPHNTIRDALARVPRTIDWHLGNVKVHSEPKVAPYSADQLAKCITTGGSVPHPSGLRLCSVRELASLNGFPADFRLPSANECKKGALTTQVGNAVPPSVWHKFMLKVKKCLTDFEDGVIDEAGNTVPRREHVDLSDRATQRLRGLSLEPIPSRASASQPRAQRERSKTLSPDPPTTPFINRWLDAVEDGAPRNKRQHFIDFSSEDQIKEENMVQRPQKLRKIRAAIDLTMED